jgi:hypothetical protein
MSMRLIGGVGNINGVRYSLEKALETALGRALFAKLVQPLLGVDDLVLRFAFDVDPCSLGGDVAAKLDQFAPDRQVIDHLCIVACRIGRDRRSGQPHQIGRAAEFFQPLVVFQEGLQGDRRRQRVLLDPGGGNLEDALVDGVEEMLGLYQRGQAVKDIVVGEDRAKELLLGLDVVRQDFGLGG